MPCPSCHQIVSGDDAFCPFCGADLTVPAPTQKPYPQKPSAAKTTFCRACGKPIDDRTKRCTGCGKQYFRGIQPLTFFCILMLIAVLFMAALCLLQEYRYKERIHELEEIIESYQVDD